MENRISFTLTDAEQAQINQHLNSILAILQPKAVVLDASDRMEILKMADGTLPFTEKAIGYMHSNPAFKPDFVSLEEADIDLNAYKLGKQFLTYAQQVIRVIEDICFLSGSEAYSAALVYYRNVKMQAELKQPGAKDIYEDLAKRFVKKSSKKSKEW